MHQCSADDAEVQLHALYAVSQLATVTAEQTRFLTLLPAIPVAELAGSNAVELQHLCARPLASL